MLCELAMANDELRVMSFNIWRNGGRSLPNTVEAIRRVAPDVVGLQECSHEVAASIATELGQELAHDGRSNAILSRHPITGVCATRALWGGVGAEITVGEQRISVFDAHLHYDNYGPYYLKDGQPEAFVLQEERRMRMPGLDELLALMDPFLQIGGPTFLVGDFNAPSHLDYRDVRWPTSLACSERGLADSYRVLHPDDRTLARGSAAFAFDEPGITWSPLLEEEPRGAFDRIDFVYFSGATPTSSITIDGRNGVDPWPSDHRAVLSTFAWR